MELKELMSYLKENIYSNMDKKDVEALYKDDKLMGELLSNIEAYAQSRVVKVVEEERVKHKRDVKSKDDLIERLREGKEENRHGSKGYGYGARFVND